MVVAEGRGVGLLCTLQFRGKGLHHRARTREQRLLIRWANPKLGCKCTRRVKQIRSCSWCPAGGDPNCHVGIAQQPREGRAQGEPHAGGDRGKGGKKTTNISKALFSTHTPPGQQ